MLPSEFLASKFMQAFSRSWKSLGTDLITQPHVRHGPRRVHVPGIDPIPQETFRDPSLGCSAGFSTDDLFPLEKLGSADRVDQGTQEKHRWIFLGGEHLFIVGFVVKLKQYGIYGQERSRKTGCGYG